MAVEVLASPWKIYECNGTENLLNLAKVIDCEPRPAVYLYFYENRYSQTGELNPDSKLSKFRCLATTPRPQEAAELGRQP